MLTRALLMVGVLAVVALAGCSQGKQDAGLEPEATATSTTGVLRGLVVDDAVRPLAAANVTVTGSGRILNGTSDEGGLFEFGGLEPGNYLVEVSKRYFIATQQTVDVRAGVAEPEITKFQLNFEPSTVPYAAVYKTEGFHECGFNALRVCSNINILTWIVICGQTSGQVCIGNVTGDKSLFLQWVDGKPDFLQAEMTWTPTLDTGRVMSLLIGGANQTELNSGFADAYNGTEGESPLMLRLSNHESEDSWCHTLSTPTCEGSDVLNQSRIGTQRSLLVQVDAGGTVPNPGPQCDAIGYCGTGFSAQQPYTMFTIVFYRYEPPVDWLFSTDGKLPPPPA